MNSVDYARGSAREAIPQKGVPFKRIQQAVLWLRPLCCSNVGTIRIPNVEDNETVAGVVKETLEDEGWQVEVCAEGAGVLERITSDADYDAPSRL